MSVMLVLQTRALTFCPIEARCQTVPYRDRQDMLLNEM